MPRPRLPSVGELRGVLTPARDALRAATKGKPEGGDRPRLPSVEELRKTGQDIRRGYTNP